MPNHWSDKQSFKILKATPYQVEGYGYLYTFTCSRGTKQGPVIFLKMSQIFSKSKSPLSDQDIFSRINGMEGEGIPTIIPLNVSKGKNEKWGAEKAIAYKDKRDQEKQKAKDLSERKEKERGEPATPEFITNVVEEWKQRQGKTSNWYKSAKSFVKTL